MIEIEVTEMVKQIDVEEFVKKYKELKERVSSVSETLGEYIDEVDENISEFEEFLADYSLKISATVWNQYEDDEVNKLLCDLEASIKGTNFKDFNKYFTALRKALSNFEKAYYQSSVEEDELVDIKYDLELPFDDMDTLLEDEGIE